MKVYAFVPAKGTSERVKNKNMRFLNGQRLYIRALHTLLQCKEIDKVFLDSDSQEMYDMVDYLPVNFMHRDASLATNATDGHKMFMNELHTNPDADIYVQLLCTSPFISPETIDNAIKNLKENMHYDSAILMKREKYYFWKDGVPEYNINRIPNSKDLPETITESMGLYIIKKDAALKCHRRYGENPMFIYGSQEELIDVNTMDDLIFAETYAKGLRNAENHNFNLIKHFVSSALLSDLLDDMKIEKDLDCGAVFNNFKCNLENVKLLGRANTLRLRSLKEGEDFSGIYDALISYEGISDNDIIIVENEERKYAYFGDLNARLAIKSGASGVIIDGATRDHKATQSLAFPVFARDYNPTDVRRRATLDYINKPIQIEGVTVSPNDLVFVDEEAVVIIFKEYEKEVIDRVLTIFKNEKDIITDIFCQKDISTILNERGAF